MKQTDISMEANNLTKVYHRGSEEITAVHDVSLRIMEGGIRFHHRTVRVR